jgi:hypothetical protein
MKLLESHDVVKAIISEVEEDLLNMCSSSIFKEDIKHDQLLLSGLLYRDKKLLEKKIKELQK